MGDEKVKHGLTFMYEPPKGFKSEEKDKDGEPEYKFEWQRVAPREGYAKNMDVTDQPFGIAVRKVKCIRCHNWGHVNTDRECPLFNNNKDESISGPSTDKSELLEDMRRDGYVLKQNVLDRKVDHGSKNQQIIPSDEEEVPETAFLKSLSTKDKKKLLKKLNEMEKPNDLRKRKKKNKIRQHPSSDDNSDDFRGKEPERKKKKSKRQPSSSDDSDSSEDERRQRKENLKRKMKKMQNSKKMQKYSTSANEGSSSEVAENGRVGSGERRRGDRRTNTRRDSEDSVLSKGARPKSGTYRINMRKGNE
ncbi:putative corepressor interacting with RBPJ 1 isoform X2 [Apostichopus japonicus]|uniref:Putative corepressor interacting with RBPJ 1 isoform X2 n=1 Tax=Stichopus japonicus TaxID=307972 RepID=A0A2G8LQI7_STIJA|nr:putative corepressor interacting with RBPJ 1 isoform X2 [Apostichopus japonicus]